MTERLLKIDQVCVITTLSESEVKRRVISQEFPQPIKVGKTRKAWVESEIFAWVKETINNARGNTNGNAD